MRIFWSQSFLVTKRDPSPARMQRRKDCLKLQIVAHCSSMRLLNSMLAYKQSYYEHFRKERLDEWAGPTKSVRMFALSPLPIATSEPWLPTDDFAMTCTTASTCCRLTCHHCANGAKTFRF